MEELKKLKDKVKDKAWRLNNLYSIVDKRQQKVPYKQNAIQRHITNTQNNRKQILKARQFGVSTNEIIDCFDDTIWKENQTTGIIAHEKDAIIKLFRIVTRAYNFLPEYWRPVIDRGGGSKYELFFPEINSRIYCDLEIRSDTISRLHVSEAAFFPDQAKLIASLQAVPIWCPITLETTPNGVDNIFYEWWQDPNSDYAKLFYPWYIFPEYRLSPGVPVKEWTQEEKLFAKKALKGKFKRVITPEQMAFRRRKQFENRALFIQEYPEDDMTCFLSSGNAAMDLVLVNDLLKSAPKPLRETETTKYYKERTKGKRYVLAADTAEGKGGDYSVGQLLEIDTREQVAVIRVNKKKPSDFAHLLNDLAHEYMQPGGVLAKLVVERNNHGHAVLLELSEHIKYPNLYFTKGGDGNDKDLGWLTDRVTRPVMLDVFIQGVEGGSVRLKDSTTLRECLTLVSNEGKIEAGTNKNDDCVMAGAIAVQVCIEEGGSAFFDDIAGKIRI